MTKREFFEAVINGTVTEEMVSFANEELVKMETRNRAAANKRSAKSAEDKAKVYAVLTDTPTIAKEIAEKVEMSPQKVSGLLTHLAKENDSIKVTEVIANKRVVKAYSV